MSSCRIASCLSTYGPYKTGDVCGSFHKLLSSYRWIVGLLDTSVAGWLDGWDGCMVGPPYAVVKSRPTPRLPAGYECILLARCQETTCRNASNKEFDFAGRSVGFSVVFPGSFSSSAGLRWVCAPSPRLMARCMFYHAWWHEWARTPDGAKETRVRHTKETDANGGSWAHFPVQFKSIGPIELDQVPCSALFYPRSFCPTQAILSAKFLGVLFH